MLYEVITDEDRRGGAPEHHPEDARAAGAERHADPDLARSPSDGERNHAVQPDRRQDQRDDARSSYNFV